MRANELRSLRKAAGMSQADLGEAIGLSRESIGTMERGQAVIILRTELAARYVMEQKRDGRREHRLELFDKILSDDDFLRLLGDRLRELEGSGTASPSS